MRAPFHRLANPDVTLTLTTHAMTPDSRTFIDGKGQTWTAIEVRNPAMPPKLAQLLPADRRAGHGWLAFLAADGTRRRLSPCPPTWSTATDAELARLCLEAVLVPQVRGERRGG